ncbi:hypothetical protein GETHLI_22520 [Geothrix limicola]|uniref:Sporadic carbohydrate cluster protein, TIGR04323 family n=1 Tax=Geothrix limicola TaxID=2927978 RepID=A0ABQ5QFY8_9BACT|nr:LIC12192 family sporadic carbohydrate cluster protein [Geothrix limicola]GLH73750.1 hypothetical protein GETHLI_22520 [Geothrix limicola]
MSKGHRGYIASRPVRGTSTPQRVQNLVVRDYARRRGLTYLLSATEYAMPGCTMVLENLLAELPRLDGIICFSIFMLPPEPERRAAIYARILAAGATFHAALENLSLSSASDVGPLEDLIASALLLPEVPFAGRYEKAEQSLLEQGGAFARALHLED